MLFPLWAVALALGIVVGWCVPMPWWVPFVLVSPCLAVLILGVRRRWGGAMLCASCVIVCAMGCLRAWTGDFDLLPSALRAWSVRLGDLAQGRLHSLGFNAESQGLLDAMLLGRREGLSRELRQLYADVGASHVLALSGMHLSIIFGILQLWMIRLSSSLRTRLTLGFVACALMWAYALVTGLPTSVIRATTMMCFVVVACVQGTGVRAWHALCLSAFVILFVEPSALTSVSFQLSYASVAGIVAFCQPLNGQLTIRNGTVRWLWLGLLASLGAQMGSLPFVLYWFHRLPLYGVLFGVVYILCATLILYGGLFALALGKVAIVPVSVLIWVQHRFMHWASQLPYAVLGPYHISIMQAALLVLALALLAVQVHAISRVRYRRFRFFLTLWPYTLAFALCLLTFFWV